MNDQTDTTAGSNGTTWVFTYDLGGNILTKKAYAYTTGTVGTAVQNHSYTYGSTDWKDKLTAYDGATIQTDNIGNPTTDGTWSYTWEHGRQLKQMSKSGETVAFEYNEDGLRTKKTSTSKGVTEYTLHGKNIVHLTRGNQSLHFFYDGQGKPSIVEWNNGTTTTKYAYVYNLQGDVIALINSAGTKVVEYTYDAWGKPTSLTGVDDLETTLGTLNPFRYRGYVYDDEIDFYYLRSRYYNANRGRFINADSVFDGINLFRYCANNPIIAIDNNGDDLVVITASNGAGPFGHTSLLIQDQLGVWWYYYYGPNNGASTIDLLLGKTVDACVIYKAVDVYPLSAEQFRNNTFDETLQKTIDKIHDKEEIKRQTYDRVIYFEGDFVPSHKAAITQLQQENKYNLYQCNCVENSIRLIDATIPTYSHDLEMHRLLFSAKNHTSLIPMGYAIPNLMHSMIEDFKNNIK